MRRVFVDTNVLFPFSVMDLLLALTEDAIHEVVWTDDLLDEWARVIVRERRRTPETAASVVAAIRGFFADSRIERASYEHLIGDMPGHDPDDHLHMAAAVAAQVDALITNNVRDFPAAALAERGVRVVDPDTYLCELLDNEPDEVVATFLRLVAEKTRPPRILHEQLESLRSAGLRLFSDRLAELL